MGTKLEGLQLAERHFGPLLLPIPATQAQWNAYTNHRLQTIKTFGDVFSNIHPNNDPRDEDRGEIKEGIITTISKIEKEMGLRAGFLLKCLSILRRFVTLTDEEPRSADVHTRLFSPSAPIYIDVHLKYYHRHVYSRVDYREFSIGYNVHRRPSPDNHPTSYRTYDLSGPPQTWHTRNGWQTVCWGCYDSSTDGFSNKCECTENGAVELYMDGILDVHEALFGQIEKPSIDDPNAVVAYRRQLLWTIRLLFAVVGLDYKIACTDEEHDVGPSAYSLEGFMDNWVARAVRKACGFQLTMDPRAEEARRVMLDDLRPKAEEDNDDDDKVYYGMDVEDEEDDDSEDDSHAVYLGTSAGLDAGVFHTLGWP